jgi:hypothetical protein
MLYSIVGGSVDIMTEIPSNQHITYQLQYRKCGKAACSTCRNTQGHGPYWYAYWREGSRLRSGYVGKNNPKPKSTDAQPGQPSKKDKTSPKHKAVASVLV